MNAKRTNATTSKDSGTPYDPRDPKAVAEYWKSAVRHTGLAELKRKRGERGPQKAPTKVPVTIRSSPDVVEKFRATGEGWQTRVDAALRNWLKKHSPA